MNHRRDRTMKKIAIAIGVFGASVLGGAVFWAWQNNRVGRILFSGFRIVLLPANFIVQSIIGTSDAYLNIYVAVDVIFMSVVGFLAGYCLYRAYRLRRQKKN